MIIAEDAPMLEEVFDKHIRGKDPGMLTKDDAENALGPISYWT